MRDVIGFWFAVLLIGIYVAALAAPEPAACAWCPPTPCLTDSTCAGCSCLIVGDSQTGVCIRTAG